MNTGLFSMDSPPNPGTTSRPICPTRSGNTSRKREKRSRGRKMLGLDFTAHNAFNQGGAAWWRSAKQTGYGFDPRFVADVDAILAET
jgi:hypothetical protein